MPTSNGYDPYWRLDDYKSESKASLLNRARRFGYDRYKSNAKKEDIMSYSTEPAGDSFATKNALTGS